MPSTEGAPERPNGSEELADEEDFALPPVVRRAVRVFGEPGLLPAGDFHDDSLAEETPVALVFNGISHAVMMATPLQLEHFALGFALSEGIVRSTADVRGVVVRRAGEAAHLPYGIEGIQVDMEISSACFAQLKQRRRTMAGRTGCGVCGVESFADLDMVFAPLPAQDWLGEVDLAAVLAAFDAMQLAQPLNAQAGSLHAAGWASLGARKGGELAQVFEDVGRHNALDKLIGWLATTGRLDAPGFVVLSSRASHELVRKCARVGIAALATISAPTSTGALLAQHAGLRLWGLCRAPRGVLYADGPAAAAR